MFQYTKTLDNKKIEIDLLIDDKMILPRERVNSVTDLLVGDHIEWLAALVGLLRPGAQHHMLVSKVEGVTCSVIYGHNLGHLFSAEEQHKMEINLNTL